MIWFRHHELAELNALAAKDGILEFLGLEFVGIGDDFLKARLVVDARAHQIHGILHGGVTCVLAETVGSVASHMCIDPEKYHAVGSVLTANHLRPVSRGHITATCRPVHKGRTKHVWDIQVHSDEGKLAAKCELTCAVAKKLLKSGS